MTHAGIQWVLNFFIAAGLETCFAPAPKVLGSEKNNTSQMQPLVHFEKRKRELCYILDERTCAAAANITAVTRGRGNQGAR